MADSKLYPNIPIESGGPPNPPPFDPPPYSAEVPSAPIPPGTVPTNTQRVFVTAVNYGSVPVNTYCGNCQNHVVTTISTGPSSLAWTMGILLFCCGFWPLACIPCCVCQTTTHTCPNCNFVLGDSS